MTKAQHTAAKRDRLKEINAELLEALQRIIDTPKPTNTDIWLGEALQDARDAIAKAKGE